MLLSLSLIIIISFLGGEVKSNIIYNFQINNVIQIPHVEFTWGTSWKTITEDNADQVKASSFSYIVASDILLYVSAYPSLVSSLVELFEGK